MLIDDYYSEVFPIIRSQPDWDKLYVAGENNSEREADYNRIFNRLASNVDLNYSRFMNHADDPMPFDIEDVKFCGNKNLVFKWSQSHSLINQPIVYDLVVATSKNFASNSIVDKVTNISGTQYILPWSHPKGTYYYRIRSKDQDNPTQHWQESNVDGGITFDTNGLPIYGVKKVFVNFNGTANSTSTGSSGSTGSISSNVPVSLGSTDMSNEADPIKSSKGGNISRLLFLLAFVLIARRRRSKWV